MSVFSKSKWIWASCAEGADQYTEYVFNVKKANNSAFINISCDSDYTLFINGSYVASNQYGDFEHYKIYDSIDITSHLTKEDNNVKILAYHCGVNTQRYRYAKAGLIFEIISGNEIIAYSDESISSRLCPTYESGRKKFISSQLGFSFAYNATKENKLGYGKSVIVEKSTVFYQRPIKKLTVGKRVNVKEVIKKSPTHYLIDLGAEVVGLATLEFNSKSEQKIEVAYGESLDDGCVRKNIGGRCFAFEYTAKIGKNIFTDYMMRLACRYLEVFCEKPIEIEYIGILPQAYDVDEIQYQTKNDLQNRIYGACVNTLRLCMMEHYVDTPWREQCLYAFDSRNQMLCGYYAFENKNKDYARANLKLMGQDRRTDGLLSICYPCGTELAIPSFSLYYIIAMKEYAEYTRDLTLAEELLDKMRSILDEFSGNMENGLVCKFTTENKWNFYDWSDYLDGWGEKPTHKCDLILNCLYVMALDSFNCLAISLGEQSYTRVTAENVRERIKDEFLTDEGFTLHKNENQYTELGNALAVLAGVADKDIANKICDKIISRCFTPASLSMNVWKYEALLKINTEKYSKAVLNEIEDNYKPMVELGNTVWETVVGSADFDNAGSLCHGWSAVPVYIYHKLGLMERK